MADVNNLAVEDITKWREKIKKIFEDFSTNINSVATECDNIANTVNVQGGEGYSGHWKSIGETISGASTKLDTTTTDLNNCIQSFELEITAITEEILTSQSKAHNDFQDFLARIQEIGNKYIQ